jgi:hypothetical protein
MWDGYVAHSEVISQFIAIFKAWLTSLAREHLGVKC